MPSSQRTYSPDTTTNSLTSESSNGNTVVNTDALPHMNPESESFTQDSLNFTKEEIMNLTKNNPIKRHKLMQLMEAPMPYSIRKRKYQQILNSDEGENMNEEQLKVAKTKIAKEKILANIASRKKNRRDRSNRAPSANVSSSQSEILRSATIPSSLSSNDSNASREMVIDVPELPQIQSQQVSGSENAVQQIAQEVEVRTARRSSSSSSSENGNEVQTRLRRESLRSSNGKANSPVVSNSSYSSRSSASYGHTNMGAPSRPHIPYPTHTTQASTRLPPKGTAGA